MNAAHPNCHSEQSEDPVLESFEGIAAHSDRVANKDAAVILNGVKRSEESLIIGMEHRNMRMTGDVSLCST